MNSFSEFYILVMAAIELVRLLYYEMNNLIVLENPNRVIIWPENVSYLNTIVQHSKKDRHD